MEIAIQRGEIDPSHLNDLLTLDVKQTILDIFKRKRVQFLNGTTTGNGKRKTTPTTEAIIPMTFAHQAVILPQETIPPPNKFTRANNEDDTQDIADFFNGYDADIIQDQPAQSINPGAEYDDLSDFLALLDWSEEEEAANLKANAAEEAVYQSIYKGANILAATV